MTGANLDRWAEWLLKRRHGDNPEKGKQVLETLAPIRAKVIEGAQITEGQTLLDVGCGDGLIAFGALERVGKRGKVIFSDISSDLLVHCESLARELGVLGQCEFALASAEDISPIPDALVDAVTTRSVLIYVQRKQQAFQEFFRVLKPGGHLSIFEPINRFGFSTSPHILWGYDITPVQHLGMKVRKELDLDRSPEGDPMLGFDERDLLEWAETAGFSSIALELQNRVVRSYQPGGWKNFANIAPNPNSPTLLEAINRSLSKEEAEEFIAYLHPLVETCPCPLRTSVAYLQATK